jgi:hypothetical protein
VTPAQMTGRTMKGSGAVRLVNHSAPSYVIDGSCRAGGGGHGSNAGRFVANICCIITS